MKIAPVNKFIQLTSFKSEQQNKNVKTEECKGNLCSKRHGTNWTAATGWATIAGLAATGATGMMHNPKLHTITASIPIMAGIAHIACVSFHHQQHHKNIIA